MHISTTERENTEKRNAFYRAICYLNKVDKRYKVYRNNSYFDTHGFFLMGYHWWERLIGFNDRLCTIDFDQRVYIRVEAEGYINFCKRIAHFFEDEDLSVTIIDNTVKAKETC